MKEIMIRKACPEDAAALLEIYAPYVRDTAVSFEYEVPSLEEFSGRIRHTLQKYPYLVAESAGKVVGYAYAGVLKARAAYDWTVETTVYVRLGEHRGGVGQKLYEALESALKNQGFLSMNACIAYTDREDEYLTHDSVKFHKEMGFRMIGCFHLCGYKFHRWYDMIWMEKQIGEHLSDQPKVLPFD